MVQHVPLALLNGADRLVMAPVDFARLGVASMAVDLPWVSFRVEADASGVLLPGQVVGMRGNAVVWMGGRDVERWAW